MHIAVNPTIGSYKTADGRFITLMMLQPGRYFADLCRHLGLEHLLEDERFQTAEGLMANAAEVGRHLAEAFAANVRRLARAAADPRRSVVAGQNPLRWRPTDRPRPTVTSCRCSTPTVSSGSGRQSGPIRRAST